MKIALLLVACFVSLTLQQNVFWSFPARRIPYYSNFNYDLPADHYPVLAASGPAGPQLYPNDYGHDGQVVGEQRILDGSNFYNTILKPNVLASRSFGLSYLASRILSSLTLSSTSTSTTYTTTVSTITAGAVVTCFTSTMFTSTTACRRKRDAMQMINSVLIGDNDEENKLHGVGDELDSEFKPLPREGRDIDPASLITSSKTEKDLHVESDSKQTESSLDGYFRQNRNVVFTSSLTSYSIYYSTSTRVVTNIAAANGLTCLPSGFNLC